MVLVACVELGYVGQLRLCGMTKGYPKKLMEIINENTVAFHQQLQSSISMLIAILGKN